MFVFYHLPPNVQASNESRGQREAGVNVRAIIFQNTTILSTKLHATYIVHNKLRLNMIILCDYTSIR